MMDCKMSTDAVKNVIASAIDKVNPERKEFIMSAIVPIVLLYYFVFHGPIVLLTLPFRKSVRFIDVLCMLVAIPIWIGLFFEFASYSRFICQAQYSAKAKPLVGHLYTQLSQYVSDNGRLPFPEGETGTYTTFVSTNSIDQARVYSLSDGSAREMVYEKNVLQRSDVSIEDILERRLTPRHLQIACLANETNGVQGYAIGTFGNGDGLPFDSGYAVQEIYFPDVDSGESYRLCAVWEKYDKKTQDIFRFGYADGDNICPLFPPEMFSPTNTITKIHGSSPECVEYWVQKLHETPNGERWKIDLPPERTWEENRTGKEKAVHGDVVGFQRDGGEELPLEGEGDADGIGAATGEETIVPAPAEADAAAEAVEGEAGNEDGVNGGEVDEPQIGGLQDAAGAFHKRLPGAPFGETVGAAGGVPGGDGDDAPRGME